MTGHIGQGDRHADRKLTIRPTEQLRVAALEALKERGLTANDYVIACLAALAADPDRQIANVAGHWPQPKPKGRPRRNADPDQVDVRATLADGSRFEAQVKAPQSAAPADDVPRPRREDQAGDRPDGIPYTHLAN